MNNYLCLISYDETFTAVNISNTPTIGLSFHSYRNKLSKIIFNGNNFYFLCFLAKGNRIRSFNLFLIASDPEWKFWNSFAIVIEKVQLLSS